MFPFTSLLAHFLRSSREDSGSVCFGDCEGDENPDDEGEDDLDVVEPAPACSIGEESTDERTDGGTDERGCGEGSHGDTAFFGAPEIGEGTTYEGHGSREPDSIESATDEEGFDILGDGAGNDEDHG